MHVLYVTNARLPTEKAHGLAIVKTCEALARAGHTVLLIAPERHKPLREDMFLESKILCDAVICKHIFPQRIVPLPRDE